MTTAVLVEEEEGQAEDIVLALTASPDFANDGICFAGRNSGLYRSADGGDTWRFAYGALGLDTPLPTTAVAVSPAFASDRSLFAGAHGGILRSLDGGENWFVAMLPEPAPLVSTLVVSPNFAEDGTVLAGTLEDGIFQSADRGGSWAPWNFGLLDLGILALAISPDFARDRTIFAGTETGLYRSTNGGRAWREVESFPTDLAPILSLALSPNYAEDGTLFAGTEAHGLLQSTDRGHTWAALGEGAIAGAVNAIVPSPAFPARPDLLVMLNAALLVSRDGGRSWSDWPADADLAAGVTALAAPHGLGPDAPLLVGLVDGGVRRL